MTDKISIDELVKGWGDGTTFSDKTVDEMMQKIDGIPFGHSVFQIEKFILGHESEERNYRQIALEIRKKYDALEQQRFDRSKHEREIELLKVKAGNLRGWWTKLLPSIFRRKLELIAQITDIEIERKIFLKNQCDKLIKDALFEFSIFKKYLDKMPALTREEFEKSEVTYWPKRLVQQAQRQVIATGRIDEGILEAAQKIGLDPYRMSFELQQLSVANEQRLALNAEKAQTPSHEGDLH